MKEKILFLILGTFFLVTIFFFSWFIYPKENFPASPDEKASQIFTERVIQGKAFILGEDTKIPSEVRQYIVPRSMQFINGKGVAYASYFGLPILYSFFGELFSYKLIFSLFSLVGAISVFGICYLLTKNRYISLAGACIYILTPPVLLYSIRGFMHNALFLHIFFSSLWLLILWSKQSKNFSWLVASGGILGFAAAVRTNEMLWAAPLYALIFFIIAKKEKMKIFIPIVASIIVFAPFALLSYSIIQSPVQYKAISGEAISSSPSIIHFIKSIFFPFGLDFGKSFTTFWQFASTLWWVTLPILLSFLAILLKFIYSKMLKGFIFTLLLFFIGLYIILFYGSFPQETPMSTVLASHSHFRYWLPLFASGAIAIPYSLYLIEKTKYRVWAIRICLIIFFVGSFTFLFFSESGIKDMPRENLIAYEKNKKVGQLISSDSIILAGRADKYFSSDWAVAGTSMHAARVQFSKELSTTNISHDVYYYHLDADISSHWTKEALEEAGVTFEYVAQFHDGGNAWEYLYKLDWPNKEQHVDQ